MEKRACGRRTYILPRFVRTIESSWIYKCRGPIVRHLFSSRTFSPYTAIIQLLIIGKQLPRNYITFLFCRSCNASSVNKIVACAEQYYHGRHSEFARNVDDLQLDSILPFTLGTFCILPSDTIYRSRVYPKMYYSVRERRRVFFYNGDVFSFRTTRYVLVL